MKYNVVKQNSSFDTSENIYIIMYLEANQIAPKWFSKIAFLPS